MSNTLKVIEHIHEPCASKTLIGWVVHVGGSQLSNSSLFHISQCECSTTLQRLEEQFSQYLSLESAEKRKVKSKENEKAEYSLELKIKKKKTNT